MLRVQIETLVRVQGEPYIIVEYTNQKHERIETGSKTVTQILDQINSVAAKLVCWVKKCIPTGEYIMTLASSARRLMNDVKVANITMTARGSFCERTCLPPAVKRRYSFVFTSFILLGRSSNCTVQQT